MLLNVPVIVVRKDNQPHFAHFLALVFCPESTLSDFKRLIHCLQF